MQDGCTFYMRSKKSHRYRFLGDTLHRFRFGTKGVGEKFHTVSQRVALQITITQSEHFCRYIQPCALLGGMPIKIIGNSFVTFYTKHLPLEFIGNYNVCEIPLKSIGKSFNIQSNYYLRRIFPKGITGESF